MYPISLVSTHPRRNPDADVPVYFRFVFWYSFFNILSDADVPALFAVGTYVPDVACCPCGAASRRSLAALRSSTPGGLPLFVLTRREIIFCVGPAHGAQLDHCQGVGGLEHDGSGDCTEQRSRSSSSGQTRRVHRGVVFAGTTAACSRRQGPRSDATNVDQHLSENRPA